MVSNVVLEGKASGDIPLRQFVRQGSVLGPWFYMLYIHDLAVKLLKAEASACIGCVPCGAVLQTDDVAFASLTANGLQQLVTLCEEYSRL